MSEIYDALRRAETGRGRSLATRIWRLVPRLIATRVESTNAPGLMLPPRQLDANLRALRDAVNQLDARLSDEMAERESKLLEEVRRGMLGLEAELSERFAASVLENRRTLRRVFVAIAFLVAGLAGLVVVNLASV